MIETLEIRTLIVFDFVFANNTIAFFFFFLITDLYFLIHAVIAQIFNPTVELIVLIKMPTKEAKAEIETHPLIGEVKMSKCLT